MTLETWNNNLSENTETKSEHMCIYLIHVHMQYT